MAMAQARNRKVNGRVTPPTWRRQFNESFETPDGSFSPSKALAIMGQAALLVQLNLHFESLIKSWDALMLVCGFVIMPEIVKKFLAMKYGGSQK